MQPGRRSTLVRIASTESTYSRGINGRIDKLTIKLGPEQLTEADHKKAAEAVLRPLDPPCRQCRSCADRRKKRGAF